MDTKKLVYNASLSSSGSRSFLYLVIYEDNPLSHQVRDVMKSSLVSIIKESVEAYKNTPRKDWVIDWPGQIVLAGSQIYWTREVEEVSLMISSSF